MTFPCYTVLCYVGKHISTTISVSANEKLHVKQTIWMALRNWLNYGTCADIHMSSFKAPTLIKNVGLKVTVYERAFIIT